MSRFAAAPVMLLALAVALVSTPAGADYDTDIQACVSGEDAPDLVIAACGRLIQSGQFDGAGLSIAYNNRGAAYANKGAYDRAIQDFDQAIRLNPGYAFAYNNRGDAYRIEGRYDRAIEDYDQVIRLDPQFALPYDNRGDAYAKMGAYDRAIQDFDRAIRLAPGDPIAYEYLALLRATGPRHLRDGGEAVRLARKALALADDPITRNTLAAAYVEAGDAGAAIRVYEAVMRMVPDWVERYQEDLAQRGYYSGPIDGDYGPGMERALAACVAAGCQPLTD